MSSFVVCGAHGSDLAMRLSRREIFPSTVPVVSILRFVHATRLSLARDDELCRLWLRIKNWACGGAAIGKTARHNRARTCPVYELLGASLVATVSKVVLALVPIV
jgi:hypothetical protein